SRSPSDRSFNSATAFKTFRRRFSSLTPVCTRSTSRFAVLSLTMVHMYHNPFDVASLSGKRLVLSRTCQPGPRGLQQSAIETWLWGWIETVCLSLHRVVWGAGRARVVRRD